MAKSPKMPKPTPMPKFKRRQTKTGKSVLYEKKPGGAWKKKY